MSDPSWPHPNEIRPRPKPTGMRLAAGMLHDIIVKHSHCGAHCRITLTPELVDVLEVLNDALVCAWQAPEPSPAAEFDNPSSDRAWLARLRAAWARQIGSKR